VFYKIFDCRLNWKHCVSQKKKNIYLKKKFETFSRTPFQFNYLNQASSIYSYRKINLILWQFTVPVSLT